MFKRIYFFFLTYIVSITYAQALTALWFYKNGASFATLILFFFITYTVSLALMYLLQNVTIRSRTALYIGVLTSALGVIVVVPFFGVWQIYLAGFLFGLNIPLLWITYNIMYFKWSDEKDHGVKSGAYFLLFPAAGIVFGPLAGFVAERYGFPIFYVSGFLIYILPLFLIRYLPHFEFSFDVRKELSSIKFDWVTTLTGVAGRIYFDLIPIFTLFFIDTPSSLGKFIGYLALMTAIASLVNGYISDKMKNRKLFFYVTSTLAVGSFIPLLFVHTAVGWGFWAGIATLAATLASPFWMVYNIDVRKSLGIEKAMVLREIFRHVGYIIALGLAFIIIQITGDFRIGMAVVIVIALTLPIAAYLQGVYKNK